MTNKKVKEQTLKNYKNSLAGKGVFPPKYAFSLLIPLRNIFLSPKELIRRLDLKENYSVLEIGPGPGYFSVPFAKFLKRGQLVLIDIQQEMLDYAQKRLKKRGLNNVEYFLSDGKSLNLERSQFDRVVMVTVIGEVDSQKEYLEEISRVLKDDGILSVSESAGDPDKLSIDQLTDLVVPCGFEVWEVFGNRQNYTLHFKKRTKN